MTQSEETFSLPNHSAQDPKVGQVAPPKPASRIDDSQQQLHLGYARARHLIQAVPQDNLEFINLDMGSTVQTVLGTVPEILELHAELSQLGHFDMDNVDFLQDYALATGHLHNQYRLVSGAPDADLVKELLADRVRLQADAQTLVLRGILDGAQVAALQSGNSHRGLAFDVIGLAGLMLERWEQFGGRTLTTKDELEHSRLQANRLLAALGRKEQGPDANAALGLERQQAFTLLVRAYNDVRDAVLFIRRKKGDGDDITPSLYAGRGRRSSGAAATGALEQEVQDAEDLTAAVLNVMQAEPASQGSPHQSGEVLAAGASPALASEG